MSIGQEGGPAFPVNIPGCGDNGWHGMSLRDWFAGLAMQAIIPANISDAATVRAAYSIADDMLKERAFKRQQGEG